ncbi:hypothetical protein VNO77_24325 [Canavalia gladiata]|uniref:Uncharacterized protein n=1 Tax=Canavalia gladiata TaxID=3824 RepID=A0AAN9QCM4_CANGL
MYHIQSRYPSSFYTDLAKMSQGIVVAPLCSKDGQKQTDHSIVGRLMLSLCHELKRVTSLIWCVFFLDEDTRKEKHPPYSDNWSITLDPCNMLGELVH